MNKSLIYRLLVLCLASSLALPSYALAGDDGLSNKEFSAMGIANYTYMSPINVADVYEFRDKLLARGWINYMEGYNRQVGTASFGYAAPSDFMYFAGHGDWDGNNSTKYAGCCLTDYQPFKWPFPPEIILYSAVDNKWNNDIEWAWFASCEVLRDARWKYPLNDAPRAHAIYGHRTAVTNDYKPTVTRFFDYVPNWTLYDSFRWANQDRGIYNWAIIGHLNNKGDYLHGVKTGATADCSDQTDIYRWYYDGGPKAVKLDTDISYNWPKKKNLFARLLDKLCSLPPLSFVYPPLSYAELGFSRPGFEVATELPLLAPKLAPIKIGQESIDETALRQWFGDLPEPEEKDGIKRYVSEHESVEVFPTGAVKYHRQSSGGPVEKSEQEALQVAKEFIASHGGLPQDAELIETGQTIQEQIDSGEKEVLAYTFKYAHKYKDIPVSYNGDSIIVEVAADGVSSFSRLWRKAIGEAQDMKQVRPASDVLEQSWTDIKGKVRHGGSPIKIDAVDLVYYSAPFDKSQDVMKPAWRLRLSDGWFVHLDAYSGNLIDS